MPVRKVVQFLGDRVAMEEMARRFGVSPEAMEQRVHDLRLSGLLRLRGHGGHFNGEIEP